MAPGKKPAKTVGPVGPSQDYRDSAIAAIDVDLAVAHIDRIYAEKILYVYGCGIVLGFVNDLFDKFMALETEKPVSAGGLFETLFSAVVDIVGAIPPLNLPIKAGATVKALIKAAQTTTKNVQANYERATTVVEAIVKVEGAVKAPTDALPEVKGQDAYLRDQDMKFPLVQKAIAAAYLLEYERQDAIAGFRLELKKQLADPKFTGTPQALAEKLFGPAPPRKTPEEVFKLFDAAKFKVFREVMKAYVKTYVVIAYYVYENEDAHTKNTFWGLYQGLNDAQWKALALFFANTLTKTERDAVRYQHYEQKMSKFMIGLPGYFRNFKADPEPILNEIADLYRMWGARKVVFRNVTDWHGLRTRSDWDLVPKP
jgi:hypothetical protein